MPSAGPGVKAVTAATTTFPGHLFPLKSGRAGRRRRAWGAGWRDPPAVLKVSQQHISLGSWHLQLPHGHGVAPPQEAGGRQRGESVGLRQGVSR